MSLVRKTGAKEPPPPPPPHPAPRRQQPPTNSDKALPAACPPSDDSKEQPSPLKAAADLIQILDTAYADMNSFAADAARDAEDARRNARAASEIARRYQNRSYPKSHSPFGSSISSPPGTPRSRDREAKQLEGNSPERSPRHGDPHASPLSAVTPQHRNTPLNPDSSGRKRKTYNTPSSTERLAQSHAEDVLSLSLELERAKQACKSEKKAHENTKASMLELQYKNKSLEKQIGKLMQDLEKQRNDMQLKIDSLEEELAYSKRQTEAAEEDAQAALDIAKESSLKREQMEAWLQSSLQEVSMLRAQVEDADANIEGAHIESETKTNITDESVPEPSMETPKRSVRFADSPDMLQPVNANEEDTTVETPKPGGTTAVHGATPGTGPSRSMVAAGRQLLRRAMAQSEGENVCAILELTPAKSAERRQRLRQRLLSLEDEPIVPSPLHPNSSPNRIQDALNEKPTIESITAMNALEENQAVAQLLKESGKRLELEGPWFRVRKEHHGNIPNVPPPPPPPPGKIQLESLAKQFCHRVEVCLVSSPLVFDLCFHRQRIPSDVVNC